MCALYKLFTETIGMLFNQTGSWKVNMTAFVYWKYLRLIILVHITALYDYSLFWIPEFMQLSRDPCIVSAAVQPNLMFMVSERPRLSYILPISRPPSLLRRRPPLQLPAQTHVYRAWPVTRVVNATLKKWLFYLLPLYYGLLSIMHFPHCCHIFTDINIQIITYKCIYYMRWLQYMTMIHSKSYKMYGSLIYAVCLWYNKTKNVKLCTKHAPGD